MDPTPEIGEEPRRRARERTCISVGESEIRAGKVKKPIKWSMR